MKYSSIDSGLLLIIILGTMPVVQGEMREGGVSTRIIKK